MSDTRFFLLSLLLTLFVNIVWGQNESNLHYEVNVNHPHLSISLEELYSAESLSDLNRMFKPEWYREYLSVEISTVQENKLVSVLGHSDELNEEQKSFLKSLTFPSPITISIDYIPENNLSENPPRNESFTFSIHPIKEAQYNGGNKILNKYLKQNVIDLIPQETFKGYDLAIITFVISEKGQVVDVDILESSNDDHIDKLLYNTICNMPNWIPAQHSNGKKIRQEFAFTVGNHESCMINIINTVNNKY